MDEQCICVSAINDCVIARCDILKVVQNCEGQIVSILMNWKQGQV
jgi:hypothetical protein